MDCSARFTQTVAGPRLRQRSCCVLLQVFYSVRSERMLMEQMRYKLLFRWFVGLAIEDAVWDHSVFSKNRDRLLEHEVIEAFFTEVMSLADKRGLLSREHFSVTVR